MKRKGVDDDFSHSSAIKIRRLDGSLLTTPIAEPEQLWIKPPMASADNIASNENPVEIPGEVMAEINPIIQENDERAIVLFKPLTTPLYQSPSTFHVSIDTDLLSKIKHNQFMASQSQMKMPEENTNQCLAVIPWTSSQIPSTSFDNCENSELMMEEDEQMMDIDEDSSIIGTTGQQTQMTENLQWQQHCIA